MQCLGPVNIGEAVQTTWAAVVWYNGHADRACRMTAHDP